MPDGDKADLADFDYPCYIEPQKFLKLALEEADRIEKLERSDFIRTAIYLDKDGQFKHEIHKSHKFVGAALDAVAPIATFLKSRGKTLVDLRGLRRYFLLAALIGHVSFWIEFPTLLNERGEPVPRTERSVLSPSKLVELVIEVTQKGVSSESFLAGLEGVDIIPATSMFCVGSDTFDKVASEWRPQWRECRKKGLVYEPGSSHGHQAGIVTDQQEKQETF